MLIDPVLVAVSIETKLYPKIVPTIDGKKFIAILELNNFRFGKKYNKDKYCEWLNSINKVYKYIPQYIIKNIYDKIDLKSNYDGDYIINLDEDNCIFNRIAIEKIIFQYFLEVYKFNFDDGYLSNNFNTNSILKSKLKCAFSEAMLEYFSINDDFYILRSFIDECINFYNNKIN